MLLLLILAVPLGLVYYYTRPAQLIPIVEAALAEASGCDVTVGNARVNRHGEIVLEDVDFRVPGINSGFGQLFTASRIEMRGEAWGLIDGSYQPSWVQIKDPVLYLTEDPQQGRFNFELIPPADSGRDQMSIPMIEVAGGEIRFGESKGKKVTSLASIHIEGALRPDPVDAGWYLFDFKEPADNDNALNHSPGTSLTGRFDLDAPAIELEVANFSYIDEYRFFLPPEFRRWSTRLAPSGHVPRMSIRLGPDERKRMSVGYAEVEFREVGLNLNVLDAQDPDQRELALLLRAIRTRLTDISGRIEIDNDHFTLVGTGRAEQTGLGISPIQYEVQAQGMLDLEQGLSVSVQSQPFTVEDRYEYVLALMPLTGDAYRRFRPSGELAIGATFGQAGPESETTWSLDLDLINAQITHKMFPLTLRGLSGQVHVTPERADIRNLVGQTAGGATVTINGFAAPASDIAEVKLDIELTDLPLDDELAAAMKEGERENLARFMDTSAYTELLEKGMLSARPDGDAPHFELGGTVDVTVPVYRPYGEEADYSIVPTIRPAGLRVLMRDFAYPAIVDSGEVEIGPDFVVIHDLAVTGLTGGGLTINGRADKDETTGDYLPRLKLSNALLPIDGLLLHAIGGDAEELLVDLGISGIATVGGELFQNPGDADVDMALDIVVTDGRAQPFGGQAVFENVEGLLHLKGKSIPRMSFRGSRGESTLAVNGSVAWNSGGETSAELMFDADQFVLERELLDLLPQGSEVREQLTALYDEYEPEGAVDAELTWKPTGGDEPDEFVAQVHPQALAFNYGEGRLTFRELAGSATVWPEYLQLNELSGTFEDPAREEGGEPVVGRITASGEIGFDDEPRIGLSFRGHSSDARGQTVGLLMPDAVTELFESVQYEGPMRVEHADLLIEHTGGERQKTAFTGSYLIEDASLDVAGLAIVGMRGRLNADILDEPGDETPLMKYEFAIDSLRVKDRRLTGLIGRADNQADRGVLRTNRVVGTVYGGTAVIEAAADLDRTGKVRLMASLHDVELGPLLNPEESPDTDRVAEPVLRTLDSGLVSASLNLETGYGEDASRLGRGSVRVRDAGLMAENPLELWSIQALNLNIPDQRGFDRAMAEFQILDDIILLEQFNMDTRGTRLGIAGVTLFRQGLRINGVGVVTYPEMALDLRMRTQITGSVEAVPFGDVVRSLRNELVAIEVKGTLYEPKVDYAVLRDTRESWNEFINDIRPIRGKRD